MLVYPDARLIEIGSEVVIRMLVYPDARQPDADTETTLRMLVYSDARLLKIVPEEMT